LILAGCSSSKNPTGGNPPGNNYPGEISQAVGTAFEQFVDGNSAMFQSLDFFAPLIAVKAANPVSAGRELSASAAATNCLDAALQGAVFAFDGEGYVVTTDPDPPADGARFLLYEVDAEGVPNVANQIGDIEITCASAVQAAAGSDPANHLSLTVVVSLGGLPQFEANITGHYPASNYSFDMTGTLYNTARQTVTLGGSVFAATSGTVVTSGTRTAVGFHPYPYEIGYSVLEADLSDTSESFISASRIPGSLDWTVFAEMFAAGNSIYSGYATYSDGFDFLTVACIGGTVESPTVVAATSGDCTVDGSVAGSYPLGGRADITDTYQVLRSLHSDVSDLFEAIIATIASP